MREVQRNALGVMTLTIVFAALTLFVRPTTLLGRVVESFDTIPKQLGDWTGVDLDSSEYSAYLPNSSILARDYVNSYGRTANLSIVYGLDVADIHKPEYCFEGEGWGQLDSRVVQIAPRAGRPHPARMLLLRDDGGRPVVCVYWYAGPAGAKDTLVEQRLEVWKSALLSGRVQPSALVRILIPVVEGETLAEQEALWLASDLDGAISRLVSRQPYITRARRTIGE